MNNVLLFLALPCVLGFIFVQCQYYGQQQWGPYDQYNQALAYQGLNSRRNVAFGLDYGSLIAAIFVFVFLYIASNQSGTILG